jgi:hypothetical protein
MTPMRILLVIDFSPGSERTVSDLAARTWPVGTMMRLLAIVEDIPPSAAELWFDAGGSLEAVFKIREERAVELVNKAAASLRQSGLAVETQVRAGSRRKAIAQEARSWAADQIIRS